MEKEKNTIHCNYELKDAKEVQPTSNPIPTSFSKLITASKKDTTWTPKIMLNISLPPSIQRILPSNTNNMDKIDIVPFLLKPSIILSTIINKELKYPKGCTLYFPGYDGPHNANLLKKDIITAAARDGTNLVVAYSELSPNSFRHCRSITWYNSTKSTQIYQVLHTEK